MLLILPHLNTFHGNEIPHFHISLHLKFEAFTVNKCIKIFLYVQQHQSGVKNAFADSQQGHFYAAT
jgi:hypothetical protein